MTLARRVEPEWLDVLPADDPRARRSRRELTRVNALMANAGIVAASLRAAAGAVPARLAEIGAGDGRFALRLVRALGTAPANARITLVDRQAIVEAGTRRELEARGWRVDAVEADVFEWLADPGGARHDAIVANLFLHHFKPAELERLLALAAGRAGVFVACEPRRSALAAAGARLLGAIGCGEVTRHDAAVSVRAGFADREIASLWPREGAWTLEEGARALQPRLLGATRVKALDALVVGGGPAGATAALALARAGLQVAVVEKAAFPRRKVCGEFISATTWPLLRRLGLAPRLLAIAGPPVHRVGFYAGESIVHAPMPAPDDADAWGRALGRESLDQELLDAAARTGARLWQPWSVQACRDDGAFWRVGLDGPDGTVQLDARVVIAAHGSWERGTALATQLRRAPAHASDLLGFKAHFREARLPTASMPLVLFPGGYGGLVASNAGRTSFSCCVRRDALRACRAARPALSAGEAVLAHAMASCRGLRESLDGAARDGPWLSAGPIQPGIRPAARGRMFVAGNAAGEAHPLVAEGLSMAIQSGWLLAAQLVAAGDLSDRGLAAARAGYARAWREQFAARVRASSAFAQLALAPPARRAGAAFMGRVPALLTWGARRSGKALALRSMEALP